MGEVVKGAFNQKNDMVYSCALCGAQSFTIDYEGSITCRTCNVRQGAPVDWLELALEIVKEED